MVNVIVDGSNKRNEMRRKMAVWTTAMKKAMARVPGVGDQLTLYDVANVVASSPLMPLEARIAWGASQFIRTHPDITKWAPALIEAHGLARGLDLTPKADLIIDAIFLLAMAIEEGRPDGMVNLRLQQVRNLMEIADG